MRLAVGGALIPLLLVLPGCRDLVWHARLLPPDSVELRQADQSAPFLKAHGTDGSVTVLARWVVDPEARTLSGEGRRYDARRALVGAGPFTLSFDQIALVETNRPELLERSEMAVLGVVAGVTVVFAGICAANPKACFGSCPTFYAGDGPAAEGAVLAEGFSSSIARPLEAVDVDALDLPGPHPPSVVVTMRNEALETHFVRGLRLLSVPRPPGGRVYRAGQRYLPAGREHAPLACRGAEGDCLAAVRQDDGEEYRSLAGAEDLGEAEVVELTFPRPAGPAGLVVRARNSLLNTFVFYQGLAWLGTRAGEAFARLEVLPPAQAPAFDEWSRLLGRAEVEALTSRGWVAAGAFGEVGPIAKETQLVELPADLPPGALRLRLRLTRGNWKLDRLALAELAGPALEPVAIGPASVRWRSETPPEGGGRRASPGTTATATVADPPLPSGERAGVRGASTSTLTTPSTPNDADALARLSGQGTRLVSLPGDAWTVTFPLPPGHGEAELFLESRGYYLEWMRAQWLPEEDPAAAVALLAHPREALRRLAPAYKKLEPEAERIFWSSRMGARP